MRLTLACHPITEIRLETPTRLDGTVLVVDPEELRRLVLEDDSFTGVDFEIIRPGEQDVPACGNAGDVLTDQ